MREFGCERDVVRLGSVGVSGANITGELLRGNGIGPVVWEGVTVEGMNANGAPTDADDANDGDAWGPSA